MRSVPLFLAVSCVALASAAHPGHGLPETHEHDNPPRELTKEQIERLLDRVIKRAEERQGGRDERKKERKQALAKQLVHRLKGGPITAELKAELTQHARRTALLRQIRYVAAKARDHESVMAADRALARENARHEAWWRQQQKPPPAPESP